MLKTIIGKLKKKKKDIDIYANVARLEHSNNKGYASTYIYVCVCERERERERN